MVFNVCYWAGCVTDSDNTGGRGVYGGCENCVPICSWKTWGGRIHLRDQVVGVSIILKWVLEMGEVRLGAGSIWLWICVNLRLYGHSNEPLFSIEDGEFLDQLSYC